MHIAIYRPNNAGLKFLKEYPPKTLLIVVVNKTTTQQSFNAPHRGTPGREYLYVYASYFQKLRVAA